MLHRRKDSHFNKACNITSITLITIELSVNYQHNSTQDPFCCMLYVIKISHLSKLLLNILHQIREMHLDALILSAHSFNCRDLLPNFGRHIRLPFLIMDSNGMNHAHRRNRQVF